jgi:hypothetical protein
MTGHHRHVMTIHTTPKELREIAGLMETKWPDMKLGDSVIVTSRMIDGDELLIGIDQVKMEMEKGVKHVGT